MIVLNDEDFLPGSISGFVLHTVMWFTRIDLGSFSCIRQCESLLLFDMPISILYFFLDDALRIVLSFALGGALWAWGGWMGVKLVRFVWKVVS